MAFKHGPIYPGVADGLVFAVDPANPKSWTGPSSDTVDSLTLYNPESGSLFNDASGSYGNNESFNFNGTDGYLNFGHNSSLNFGTGEFTILCWVEGISSFPGGGKALIWKGGKFDNNLAGWNISWANSPQDAYFIISSASSRLESRTNPNSGLNGWSGFKMIGMQRSGTNWNQIVDTTVTTLGTFSGNVDNTEDLLIAKHGDPNAYLDVNIGPVLIYNKALSSSEITHNYNRLKSRFGL